LPDVFAADLEAALWGTITATLLDPDVLAAGLEAAQQHRSDADTTRHGRLELIDQELKSLRHILSRQLDELVEAGPEARKALRAKIADQERSIIRFEQERAGLAAAPTDGLTTADAEAVMAFAAHARAGLDAAQPADRRMLYDILNVRGTVRAAADTGAVPIGTKYRYLLDWTSTIPLSNSAQSFK
jgi:hypothetical protein